MIMNRAQKFGFAMMAIGLVAPVVLDYVYHIHATRKPKLSAEDLLIKQEQLADRWAKGIVKETIHNGDGYEDRLVTPAEDFEFHRISYFYGK